MEGRNGEAKSFVIESEIDIIFKQSDEIDMFVSVTMLNLDKSSS